MSTVTLVANFYTTLYIFYFDNCKKNRIITSLQKKYNLIKVCFVSIFVTVLFETTFFKQKHFLGCYVNAKKKNKTSDSKQTKYQRNHKCSLSALAPKHKINHRQRTIYNTKLFQQFSQNGNNYVNYAPKQEHHRQKYFKPLTVKILSVTHNLPHQFDLFEIDEIFHLSPFEYK